MRPPSHRNRRERASQTPRGSSNASTTAATKRRSARTLWLQWPAAHLLRSSSLTALAPLSHSFDSYDGFQGRFHLLLHLRVCQRGSPRQARRPGAWRHAPLPARSRAHRTPSPAGEKARLSPPKKPEATTLPPGKRARRDASTARTDFSIERERTELTLTPPAPSRRADLRCRARRVPRRGSRLQGAFSRPFCEGRFSRCLTSTMIDDERRAMGR